jgi:hypothetical protein
MAITDRHSRWLNLPEENVSDLRAAVFRQNARDCQHENNSSMNSQFRNDSAAMMERRIEISPTAFRPRRRATDQNKSAVLSLVVETLVPKRLIK